MSQKGTYPFLQELLVKASEYESQHSGAPDVQSFARWLEANTENTPPFEQPNEGETMFAPLLVFSYRYARLYMKKAIDGSALSSADDWGFLMNLLDKDGQTKMELIESQIFEKTSGMEVINRLIRQGFIAQEQGTSDKRSKQLHITEQGSSVAFGVMQSMQQVADIVRGNLTDQELTQLENILEKLHHFHTPIYKKLRNAPLNTITDDVQKRR